MRWIRPWELVASVAGGLHAVDPGVLGGLTGHSSRRAHAATEVESVTLAADRAKSSDRELLQRAFRWLEAHMPEDLPPRILHGDLLGQNILVFPDEPTGVIDWEYATTGDPAYDIAIVTRAAKKPFGSVDGLGRLLEAYASHAPEPVGEVEVRFYELCLLLRWYLEEPVAGVREDNRRRLSGFLSRLGS
ncbi:MAG: phosphotransferase [Myxococcales bacterium]|nr:phosphotransferase [Myxococcales bacterium]